MKKHIKQKLLDLSHELLLFTIPVLFVLVAVSAYLGELKAQPTAIEQEVNAILKIDESSKIITKKKVKNIHPPAFMHYIKK